MFNRLKKFLFPPKDYIVNTRSKEIHSKHASSKACRLNKLLDKNRLEVTHKEAKRLFKEDGYDTCGWCFKYFNPLI